MKHLHSFISAPLLAVFVVQCATSGTGGAASPSASPQRPGRAVVKGPEHTPQPCNAGVRALNKLVPEEFTNVHAVIIERPTIVAVTVDARGHAIGESIRQSSGFRRLDDATLKAAAASQYAPAIVRCRPRSGIYLYVQHWERM